MNSPKYLISAQQTSLRANTPDKKIKIAKFDNLDFRKYHVEVDGQRYPRDSVLINYEANDYIQPYKALKLFFEKYIGEAKRNPLISYPDIKTKHPIEIIDLRHQPDHITSKKLNYFEKTAQILTILDCSYY